MLANELKPWFLMLQITDQVVTESNIDNGDSEEISSTKNLKATSIGLSFKCFRCNPKFNL